MCVLAGMQLRESPRGELAGSIHLPNSFCLQLLVSKLGVICVRSLSYVDQGLREAI